MTKTPIIPFLVGLAVLWLVLVGWLFVHAAGEVHACQPSAKGVERLFAPCEARP